MKHVSTNQIKSTNPTTLLMAKAGISPQPVKRTGKRPSNPVKYQGRDLWEVAVINTKLWLDNLKDSRHEVKKAAQAKPTPDGLYRGLLAELTVCKDMAKRGYTGIQAYGLRDSLNTSIRHEITNSKQPDIVAINPKGKEVKIEVKSGLSEDGLRQFVPRMIEDYGKAGVDFIVWVDVSPFDDYTIFTALTVDAIKKLPLYLNAQDDLCYTLTKDGVNYAN